MNRLGLFAAMAALVIGLAGCGGGGSTGGNGAQNITVVIAPKTASVTQGGTHQFSATVNGAANTAVTWSVVGTGGGTISASGLYTAPGNPGTYSVKVASQIAPAVSDTATVTVVAGTPTPTVAISAKAKTLSPGGTYPFSATVGGTTNTAVTWSVVDVGGGTISTAGVYTAPATPGTYSVKVTTQAAPATSDTATVTVQTIPLAWRAVSLSGAEWSYDTQAKLMSGTYGSHWYYPTTEEVAYFQSKGMNMVRVPFRWERMQPTLGGAFDQAELGRLKSLVNSVTANGVTVLIDVHNYARYGFDTVANTTHSPRTLIGTAAVPVSAFVDLWTRLATEFKSNPNVMFGLMNEPHDMDIHVWVNAANQAIAAIRTAGATNTITVPGVQWTGAWAWSDTWYTTDGTSNATEMLKITDSGNNLLFEVHQYLDKNYSGIFDTTVDPNSSNDCVYDYTTTLVKFTTWLKVNNKKGLLGEIGAPSTPACNKAVADALGYVQANADAWAGWMWWAAGPKWGTYPLSIEPAWTGTWPNLGVPNGDKPQMSVLAPYLK